jgi:hypothetical protein
MMIQFDLVSHLFGASGDDIWTMSTLINNQLMGDMQGTYTALHAKLNAIGATSIYCNPGHRETKEESWELKEGRK